jgi:uncharacterized membrane protein YkvA (DUF1232 family)
MAELPERMLQGTQAEAERVANDQQKTAGLLDDALRKAEQQESRLRRVWTGLMTLLRLARGWRQGRYRDVPWRTVVLILAALLYFVNPLDIIPDAIFALGYLDDATVIAWVLRSAKKDVDRFLEGERAQEISPAS